MKWIKASERLPEDGKLVEIKTDTTRATYARWSKDNNAFVNIIDVRYPPTLYFIEWLDESATPPPVQSDSGVEEVARLIVINNNPNGEENFSPSVFNGLVKDIVQVLNQYSLKTKELREALEEIEKSLYIGDDLNDKEILHFYVEVVKTIKKEIHKALNNNQ